MKLELINLCISIYIIKNQNLMPLEKIEILINEIQKNKTNKLINLTKTMSENIEELLEKINTILKEEVSFQDLVELFKKKDFELKEVVSKELLYDENIFENVEDKDVSLENILETAKESLSINLNNGIGQSYGEYLFNTKKIESFYFKNLEFSHGEIDCENIHLLYFNDFHGNVTEETGLNNRNIGMSKLVGYVNNFKRKHQNTIILSGGDNYQGTSDSNLTMGRAVSEMFRQMNITASAVGNHEFDWGFEQIESWAKSGNFKFLAANIIDTTTNEPVDWAMPYMIEEVKGIKIGIIGLSHPETSILTKVEHTKNLKFVDHIKTAQHYIDHIKKENLADVIIALTHLDSKIENEEVVGLAADLAKNTKGLDLILSAHSHLPINKKVNGVPIIQTDYNGRAISSIELKIENKKVISIDTNLYMGKNIKSKLIKDEEAEENYQRLQEELEPIKSEIIGYAKEKLKHDRKDKTNMSNLGRWSCEAMIKYSGADIAIQNGGGLRRSLEQGNITMGDMYEIMPFDNHLVSLELLGKELLKVLEHGINMPSSSDAAFGGVKIIYDSKKDYGNRILSATLEDNTPIKAEEKYRIVINDFLLTGGDGYDFNMARNIRESYVPLRDILVEKIRKDKEIEILETHLIDIRKVDLSQRFEAYAQTNC